MKLGGAEPNELCMHVHAVCYINFTCHYNLVGIMLAYKVMTNNIILCNF